MPTSAIVVLLVAVSASLAGVFLIQDPSTAPSPDERTVTELSPLALDDNLPSWNPAVECAAAPVTLLAASPAGADPRCRPRGPTRPQRVPPIPSHL